MGISRLKLITVLASVIWCGLVLYLVSNAEELKKYQGPISKGIKWAEHLLPKDLNFINQTSSSTPSPIVNKPPQSSIVNVVMQSNEDDLGGLIAAVHSILKNSLGHVNFLFIVPDNKTQEHLRQWLTDPALDKVKYSVGLLPSDWASNPRIGKIIFPEIFPDLHGPAIYLDADVIVQGDLHELLHQKPAGHSVGLFSEDCHSGSVSKTRVSHGDNRYGKRLNLRHPNVLQLQKDLNVHVNPMSCTFSTGVFVVHNVDSWREEIVKRSLSLVKTHQTNSILGTQGGSDEVEAALLLVLYERTTPLDPLWHVRHLGTTSSSSRYSSSYLKKAKLIHWNGHFKPWGRRAPEQQLWDRYFINDPTGKFKPIRKTT